MTLHVAIATTMAPKKNPADPTRSGTSSSKGKGRARQPSPTPEPSDNPEEPKFYAPPDLSDNDFPPLPAPPPKQESKRARRERLEQEAENDYAAFEARHRAQQAPASQEEIDRLLACQPPQIEVPGPPAPRADSLSASCPTSLWSENSEHYLQVPSHGGTSSGDGVKMWTLTPNTNQPVARRGVVIVVLIEWCSSSNLMNRKIWCQSVPTYNQGLERRQT